MGTAIPVAQPHTPMGTPNPIAQLGTPMGTPIPYSTADVPNGDTHPHSAAPMGESIPTAQPHTPKGTPSVSHGGQRVRDGVTPTVGTEQEKWGDPLETGGGHLHWGDGIL